MLAFNRSTAQQQQSSASISGDPPVVTIPVWPSPFSQTGTGGGPGLMEPIPEEDDFASPSSTYSSSRTDTAQHNQSRHLQSPSGSAPTSAGRKGPPTHPKPKNAQISEPDQQIRPDSVVRRTVESKQRLREVHTTEEVDTLVSTWMSQQNFEIVIHTKADSQPGGICHEVRPCWAFLRLEDNPCRRQRAPLNWQWSGRKQTFCSPVVN
ncbi:hypothetical protein Ddc_02256 [Ditylenchus destructor]|nr:hypothetical protein Ddc_02256 [Ditylenchus destructor]